MYISEQAKQWLPAQELRCPDCKGYLDNANEGFVCNNCSKLYGVIDGIHNLLPTKRSLSKAHEDELWSRPFRGRMGRMEAPWRAVVAKASDIRVWESLFSSVDFSGKILEVGAGCCWASSLIKLNHPLSRIYASDLSFSALVKGKRVSSILEASIDFFVALDIESIPFQDNNFDFVLSVATLHHLEDPVKGLAEIRRVLCPDGRYLALGELYCNPLLKRFYRRMTDSKSRSEEEGIIEETYSFDKWISLIRSSGFQHYRLTPMRDRRYPRNALDLTYYALIRHLPEALVNKLLLSTFMLKARK